MVYDIEDDRFFLLSKEGTYEYIQNDLVYLLKIDYYESEEDMEENNPIMCIYKI